VTTTIQRPPQIYALAGLWALKGFQSLLTGIVGTGFFVWGQASRGVLQGYGLQLAIQSMLFSLVLASGSFYVMGATWLGRGAARFWGIVLALLFECVSLAYLVTRPPEFGGDVALVRTVIIDSVVNLGIIAVLHFDGRVRAFLGDAPLIGWWAPRR
jgi:hypothetical protein